MTGSGMALEAKTAIRKAFDYAHAYEDFLAPGQGLKALRLEEVGFDDAQRSWRVTLGFDTGRTRRKAAGAPLPRDHL
jgi:hypothetical protein